MTLYTYSFINKKRDLSDIMSTVIKDEPRFISNFNCRETATAQKHEWFEDQLAGRSVTATGASGNTINASAADLAKLKVGTLLVVQNDSALFQVTAVNEDSFNVSKVVANGSVTENVNAQDVLNIVSSPMAEGSNSGDGEEAYHQSATEFNCTQIFRKDIIITGSAIAIDVYGGIDNQINRQTAFALGELARDLNRVALFGRRVEAAENVRGEAGGLYFFATREGSMQINANSKKFDSIMVNDAAQAILSAGGDPVQILCSPGQARVLSNEYRDQLQIVRSDDRRGAYVAVIVNEINGRGMTIMADPDMPDHDAFVLDPTGCGLAPLRGRAISDEDATPKGFDGVKRMALGELTFEFKNAKQRLCRIKGVMPSATALAGIKANLGAVTVANTEDNPIPTKAVTE